MPPPAGACDAEPSIERTDAIGEPSQLAERLCGSAPPIPSSLTSEDTPRSVRADSMRRPRSRARAYDVRKRLSDDEVEPPSRPCRGTARRAQPRATAGIGARSASVVDSGERGPRR